MLPYLVLLRMGFSVPSNVAADAVGSYPTVSPLPSRISPVLGGLLSVPLSVALGLSTYNARPLAGILPYEARTFLPPPEGEQRPPSRLPKANYTRCLTVPPALPVRVLE